MEKRNNKRGGIVTERKGKKNTKEIRKISKENKK